MMGSIRVIEVFTISITDAASRPRSFRPSVNGWERRQKGSHHESPVELDAGFQHSLILKQDEAYERRCTYEITHWTTILGG